MAIFDFHLKGQKVLLTPFLESDINDSYIGWLNDPNVVKYSNQRFITHDRESCFRYKTSFDGTENLFLSVLRQSDNISIGTMTAYISPHHRTVDVGIMIGNPSAWGKGFGQDAWNTMMSWLLARDYIRKLTAGTLACNYGMIKLMERSGMSLEATRKAQELVDGRPEDMLFFAKFNGN